MQNVSADISIKADLIKTRQAHRNIFYKALLHYSVSYQLLAISYQLSVIALRARALGKRHASKRQ
ncbi:hypothetical protein BJP34_03000 [Moorena producens PAL-8-15-08-1]|uniref:Uncharacterized protein n=1 Tax=Moorena producens PAL-8-15-08-1 TaxID=1458985 RepID=A0A1D8TLQ6_9CYAN|nr:hypothetical protein BJP34_03000 [Moorena producens PAL-8-15-08-1]